MEPTPTHRPLRPWQRVSLRQKLVAMTAVLVGSIAVFMWLFFPSQLHEQAVAAIDAKARSIIEMAAYAVGPALDFNNLDELEEGLQPAFQFEDVMYAVVLSPEGKPLAALTRNGATLPGITNPTGQTLNAQTYHVEHTVARDDQLLGTIHLGFSLAPLEARLSRSRTLIGLVSTLVFVLGLAVAFGIAHILTRPLLEMVDATTRVAAGDYTQRAPVVAHDEVGHLAHSFNEMVGSLEAAYGAIQSSEARFRTVIEHASDLIAVLNEQMKFTFSSPASQSIIGMNHETLLGAHALSFIHPEDRPAFMEAYFRAIHAPGTVVAIDTRWKHQDDGWRYLAIQGRSLAEQEGIEGFLLSARDVTDTKAFEQQLVSARDQAEQMVRLKDTFLANMSHELRTPLTGILGIAQILMSELDGPQRELLELVEGSGNRLLSTLNSVLDLAQLEAETVQLNLQPLNVYEEVVDLTRLLGPLAEQKDLTLSVVAPASPIEAMMDRSVLERILNNLVGNAIKFTDQGSITIDLQRVDDAMRIQVRDTGRGISADFLPHLFDEFQQESSGLSRTFEGNGLGLAITRGLVELMDGTITVESIQHLGSVFTICLPIVLPPDVSVPQVAAIDTQRSLAAAPQVRADRDQVRAGGHQVQAAGDQKKRVLVVEDTPATCVVLKRWLAPNVDVTVVHTPTDTRAALQALPFDLVLMDINLGHPGDGVALMHEARTLSPTPLPILAMTAYARPQDRARFLNEGFDDYLAKPFTEAQLLHTVREHLHPATQDRFEDRPPMAPSARHVGHGDSHSKDHRTGHQADA